ncbi:MAG: peroxide stress protein YaaA [Erysipelotrichaceae bacterium]|nr:peroxide stress protein YaaA [Erysipelotrichaceae bacterium]
MKIIIAPAKKMAENNDDFSFRRIPVFLNEAKRLQSWLRSMTFEERKMLWACSEKIARESSELLDSDLESGLSPAIVTYVGIQYQTMSPSVFTDEELEYVEENLRILSGFYGILRPFDGIRAYRLEMQAKRSPSGGDLYHYWGDRIYRELRSETETIINLASAEYSKVIERYLQAEDRFLTFTFAEKEGGRFVTKGVYAKIARGDMVRYMAENRIRDPEDCKAYNRLGYRYDPISSDETHWIFVR